MWGKLSSAAGDKIRAIAGRKGWRRSRLGFGKGGAASLFLTVLILSAPPLRAAWAPRPASLEELVLGKGVFSPTASFPNPRKNRCAVEIIAGERVLFELSSLREDFFSLRLGAKGWGASIAAAQLESPVGWWKALSIRCGLGSPSGSYLTVAATCYRLAMPNWEGEGGAHLSVACLSPPVHALRAGARLDGIKLDEEGNHNAESSLFFELRAGALLSLFAFARVRADKRWGLGASVLLSADALHLGAGYEEMSGVFRLLASLAVGPVRFSLAGEVHPVLGTSRGLELSWSR